VNKIVDPSASNGEPESDRVLKHRHWFADETEARLNAQLHRLGTLQDSSEIIREERWERG
jgi:hypothetical protein